MKFHIIIPARLNSQRLPGKIIADIAGKPLIQHTYERALLCGADSVTIAVDDPKVETIARSFGANICMTAVEHRSGTERLAEVVEKMKLRDDEIIVNIQGDEPLVSVEAVQLAATAMHEHQEAAVTTLCVPIVNREEAFEPNICKVVLDKMGYALYFSRAPIPFHRREFNPIKDRYYRHVGLYAYRVKTLKKYITWEASPLEEIEILEQLRILWHGEKIHVSVIKDPLPPGIDIEADLIRFRSLFHANV